MALKAADVGISIASKEVEEEDSVNAAPSIAAPFSTKARHVSSSAHASLAQTTDVMLTLVGAFEIVLPAAGVS